MFRVVFVNYCIAMSYCDEKACGSECALRKNNFLHLQSKRTCKYLKINYINIAASEKTLSRVGCCDLIVKIKPIVQKGLKRR